MLELGGEGRRARKTTQSLEGAELTDEERQKIKTKNAQFRAQAEKAENGLLALVGVQALDMDALGFW